MDFTAIERAGISQLQAGKLLGVSRVTVNQWCKGRIPVSEKQIPRVTKFLRALESAIAAGDLPAAVRRDALAIRTAIVKHLPSKPVQE